MLAGMDLTLYTRLFYNSQRFTCLCLKSAWVRGVGAYQVHMGIVCLPGDSGSQRMKIGASGTHAPAVGSCHAGAGIQTAVLNKETIPFSLPIPCCLNLSSKWKPPLLVCLWNRHSNQWAISGPWTFLLFKGFPLFLCVCIGVSVHMYVDKGALPIETRSYQIPLQPELWDA